MICKICGKDIGSKGIASHLKTHSISSKEYYDTYVKTESDGICRFCGKPTKFISALYGYNKHCSNTCAQLNPETRAKYSQTCLKKYGATNVYASDYGKNKIKETCLERYGTETALQSEQVKEKIKQTNLKRYGCENPQQNKDIKAKTIKTNLARYGNACAVHGPEIWDKAVATIKRKGKYSKLESYLETFFINNSINYKSNYSKDSRYPFHCDFYLPDFDMFIEINNFWHHTDHFFDKNNSNDLETLNYWTEKAKTKLSYKVAIEVWTIRDVEKLKYAKQNNLNYVVLWNKEDIDNFITNFTNT